jgi:hypothetical protein
VDLDGFEPSTSSMPWKSTDGGASNHSESDDVILYGTSFERANSVRRLCSAGVLSESTKRTGHSQSLYERRKRNVLCFQFTVVFPTWTSGSIPVSDFLFSEHSLPDTQEVESPETGRSSRTSCVGFYFKPCFDSGTASGVHPRALAACTLQFFVVT